MVYGPLTSTPTVSRLIDRLVRDGTAEVLDALHVCFRDPGVGRMTQVMGMQTCQSHISIDLACSLRLLTFGRRWLNRGMGSTPSDTPGRYTPTVSDEYATQIQRWHERAYREGRAETASETTVSYLGATIVVPPEVMPITPMSRLLGEAVLAQVRPGDRVLDMGTGSGVNAVLAAMAGADVVAVDTNPHALDTAAANAVRNDVAQRIEVRHSDVFSAVDGAFDLIVFDPPFRWFRPRDLLESAMTDENYRAMTEFFTHVRRYLTPRGTMLIFFGTSGDLGYLTNVMTEHGFTADTVAHDQLTRDGWTVEYFTFLVT